MNRSPRRFSGRESPKTGNRNDRSPGRMYPPSNVAHSSSGGQDQSPTRRPSPNRRNYPDSRGGSPRRGGYAGDRSPRRGGFGGRGERRDRSFWSNEPRDMERSWRSSESNPPPPPPRGFQDRKDVRSDRGKSRSPRGYEVGPFSKDFSGANRGAYRGRGGRGRRDMPRGDGDVGFARSNCPPGVNGAHPGTYGPDGYEERLDEPLKAQNVDTSKFNASQALKMFSDRWQTVFNDLRNDELSDSDKPHVFKSDASGSVLPASKLSGQPESIDFLAELQKMLAANKEDAAPQPKKPSD